MIAASEPFPQFNNVTFAGESGGRLWYDALQLRVEKRDSQGLVLLFAYTWSKNLEQLAFLNSQNTAPVKNVPATDRPQRLVLSGVGQLPFGRGWNILIGGCTTGSEPSHPACPSGAPVTCTCSKRSQSTGISINKAFNFTESINAQFRFEMSTRSTPRSARARSRMR